MGDYRIKNLAAVTAGYIDRPYSEYGCVDLVWHVLQDLGTPMPPAVDGWSLANYRELVARDIRAAQNVMVDVFNKIGRPGNPCFPAIGNLVVIEQPGGVRFPAVYVGSETALASFIRKGVKVFKIDDNQKVILARRLD